MTERTRIHAGGTASRAVLAGPPDGDEAVVFVHGNPGSCDDWEPLAGAVGATGTRALALDLPDFGETAAPVGFEHTTDGYAAWLGVALDELGVRRVHLVMHDFGGPIGLTWAASAPDRVASVAVMDTGVLPGYRWHRLARLWRTPVVGELFQATATRRAFRLLLGRAEPRGLPRAFVDRMYDHYDRRTRRAVLKLYRATNDPSALSARVIEALKPRDLPALVIWGEHDSYLPNAFAYRQREAFPSADVHVLATSGHFPFADAPETVERLLLAFLARVRGSADGAPLAPGARTAGG